MTYAGRLWSKVARVRQHFAPDPQEDWEQGKIDWIRRVSPGKSFCDVGGLFRYLGEMAFIAEAAGATDVTVLDVGDPDLPCAENIEWGIFADKRRDRGSSVRYVQGDLEDPVALERVGPHDVVFCSGVIYHTPNPLRQLMQLREITKELLFLSTLTIPEIPGFPQACVFYPYLSEADRHPYAVGYHFNEGLLGIGEPIDERPMVGHGNCWFGMTKSALVAMLRTARFEVVEERPLKMGAWQTDLIARPIADDPMLPPLFYFRERGEARERGEPRWTFETWYEDQRRAAPDSRGAP
jgi:hypothetical protein